MRPFLSWQGLAVLIAVVLIGVLWWPSGERPHQTQPVSCEAESLYLANLQRERQVKDSLFRIAPNSPIPPERREMFSGLAYYPSQAEWCRRGRYERDPNSLLPVVGRLYLNLPTLDSCQGPAILTVYGDSRGENPYVAFWDSTAAAGETYAGGRYVPLLVKGDSAIIDFNRAYFPYCAYNPNFICLPYPPANRFCLYIRAGERNSSHATHP